MVLWATEVSIFDAVAESLLSLAEGTLVTGDLTAATEEAVGERRVVSCGSDALLLLGEDICVGNYALLCLFVLMRNQTLNVRIDLLRIKR